jgi:hypothetical protein
MPMMYDRLLAYRSGDELAGITDSGRELLLGEVLAGSPSAAVWEAVVELFALWPDGPAKARQLAHAEQLMGSWDDELRAASTANGWLYDGRRVASVASLVRTLRIYRRDEHGRSDLLLVANATELAGLRRLSVVRSDIQPAGWKALAESSTLSALQRLDVQRSILSASAAPSLLSSRGFPRLEHLTLDEVGLTVDGLSSVGTSTPFPQLAALDLSGNLLYDDGVRALSRSSLVSSVQRLSVRQNLASAAALADLVDSPMATRLQVLDISSNRVSGGERAALIERAAHRQIQLVV